jgi:hypothetical protein
MSNRTLVGNLALSKLIHVKMEVEGKSGKVKGIFIPLAVNHIVEGSGEKDKDAVYIAVRVLVRSEEDQYGQHGFISQSVDSKTYKAASEDEKKKFNELPIMGNIKDFSLQNNDNAGAVEPDKTFAPTDKMPF